MPAAMLMLWSSNATAQEKLALGGSCLADVERLCPGIPPGQGRLRDCMREHITDVSLPCLLRLAKFAGCRRERCWDSLWRVLRRGEGIGSGHEVNGWVGRLFGE